MSSSMIRIEDHIAELEKLRTSIVLRDRALTQKENKIVEQEEYIIQLQDELAQYKSLVARTLLLNLTRQNSDSLEHLVGR